MTPCIRVCFHFLVLHVRMSKTVEVEAAAAARQNLKRSFSCSTLVCHQALLLLFFSGIADTSRTIIHTLPGFTGNLPFKLETGYVGIGENEDVQLFYYFVESQRSPEKDPLLLWLTGGPGCSTLTAFFYESGPLAFDAPNYSGGLPALDLNPFAWTKVLNIIYLDAPVGTGFSYARSAQGYYTGDKKSAAQTYEFLRKWLIDHPEFLPNQLYIGGDSYSGIVVPIIIEEISNGNEVGLEPSMNLKGYLLGNPKTDTYIDSNSRIPFAHMLALIPNELYEAAKQSCKGNYVYVDPSNKQCLMELQIIDQCLSEINEEQVLEPKCSIALPNPKEIEWDRRSLKENSKDFLLSQSKASAYWCRNYGHVLSAIWANDVGVQEALHVRKGTTVHWTRCNLNLLYTKDVLSSVAYHQNLSKGVYNALIYSGDHDMSIPHVGTREWIRSLNLSTDVYWHPWFVDGQVAGFAEKYTENEFSMTFATIKGGGHVAPEYKPKEVYAMLKRWFAYYPL